MSRHAGSSGPAPRTPSPPDHAGRWTTDGVVRALLTRSSFPPAATRVTCAVSGGADSSALLVLAVAAGCRVEAVHVDHGLRPAGREEAAQVARLAARLGAGFRSESVDVPPGGNLEARARHARYAVLPPGVLTGHTADDQAETVLVNLLRGAALDGLGGMRPGPARPLLGLRRAETRALCEHLGIDVLEDPTNRDPRHLRNRVRHELLPLLADLSGRDPVPLLCRQGGAAPLCRGDLSALGEHRPGADRLGPGLGRLFRHGRRPPLRHRGLWAGGQRLRGGIVAGVDLDTGGWRRRPAMISSTGSGPGGRGIPTPGPRSRGKRSRASPRRAASSCCLPPLPADPRRLGRRDHAGRLDRPRGQSRPLAEPLPDHRPLLLDPRTEAFFRRERMI